MVLSRAGLVDSAYMQFHADMRKCISDIYICDFIFQIYINSMRLHADMRLN